MRYIMNVSKPLGRQANDMNGLIFETNTNRRICYKSDHGCCHGYGEFVQPRTYISSKESPSGGINERTSLKYYDDDDDDDADVIMQPLISAASQQADDDDDDYL